MKRLYASAFAVLAVLGLAFAPGVLAQEAGPFSVRDLERRTYELSSVDVKSCIEILGMLGYNTKAPSGQVKLGQLPAIFALPGQAPQEIVGHSEGKKAQEMPLKGETLSAPLHRLMILYHASQGDAVGKLIDLLQETIDVPDRQVLIEGMIIELSEKDLKELGTQWEYFGKDALKVTFLNEGSKVPFVVSYNPEFTPSAALADRLRETIRMIIQEGKAEVLSSPSVLVLNNRNARIKVVRDTPIVSSKISFDTRSIDVRFEPVGIVLNIKPRINQDNTAVTMQIVAEVSNVPEGESIIIEGTEVAPAIDRRIVETVARVHDNTPFIIGGLIRNSKARTLDRIPVLSRIPILGALFRRSVTTRQKREVIIVLTPRIITPTSTHRPVLPKDSARFDFLNNRLFRNSYRIKAEDLFDLSFLQNNDTILSAFDQARGLVRRQSTYAALSPFRELAARIIPGEEAVVVRMIYEILKKSDLAFYKRIPTESIIFLQEDESRPGGFSVEWLQSPKGRKKPGLLEAKSPDGTLDGYFARKYPKDVLFLSFQADPDGGLKAALQAPVAKVEWRRFPVGPPGEPPAGGWPQEKLADLAGDQIKAHVLEINELDAANYSEHEFGIVLNTAKDLVRLKTAIAIREVAQVNNFEELMALRNFRVGRRFVLPELDPEGSRSYLIDAQVAEYFYKSDYYYHALKEKLELSYQLLQEALAREDAQ